MNNKQGLEAPASPEKVERLLELYGVASEFIQFSGDVAHIPLENRLNILRALGLDVDGEEAVDRQLELAREQSWDEWVEPVIAMEPGAARFTFCCHPDELDVPVTWVLKQEDGECQEGQFIPRNEPCLENPADNRDCGLREVSLGTVPDGYHLLTLSNDEKWVSSRLIVAPERCFEPDWLQRREKIWGMSAQLYGISSGTNWGIGDFSDLQKLIVHAARLGADFILLNPLHSLNNRYPENASPYSPIDRRFLNPLYIDASAVDEFSQSVAVQDLVNGVESIRQLELVRANEMVDYCGVFQLKYRVFMTMFASFKERHLEKGTARARSFLDYVEEEGSAIREFAGFQAEHAVEGMEFTADPEFHLYLQWLADQQLQQCQSLALEQGMKVGLIRDLAVGGGIESCEVQTNPDLFCLDARIGAPPDNFNPDGQNWGLPPIRPDMLRQTRFEHFITLLQENMTSCGALRIDHVMGLMRLWWCPTDGSNASGAYVHYPVKELFAILRLESQRKQCIVIGEDLGVVPPEIRHYIDSSGVLSNVIFYFEKYDPWNFRKPEHYPERALAIIANHDVPPLKAWWNRNDLMLRRELGLIPDDDRLQVEMEHRQQEKNQVLQWLTNAGVYPVQWHGKDCTTPYDAYLGRAILEACGKSASLLVSVQLDDLTMQDTPVNIPGTAWEYPNWRRKLGVPVERLLEGELSSTLLAGLRHARP